MRYITLIVALLIITRINPVFASEKQYAPWIVYYSNKATPESLLSYNLLVFDSDYHPTLRPFIDTNKTILGYLSLGEVEKDRSYFYDMKNSGILLKENANWPGSFVVDIRQSKWSKMVIEQLIPHILNKGFKGVFLDTLDSPLELERQNQKYYGGMKEAALNLIKTIRQNYPSIKIMINRAYEILPEAAPYIDMQLGEAVYTDYNFNTQTYQTTNPYFYQKQIQLLRQAKRINPKLSIFTLDYWNPNDKEKIKDIYKIQKENGFYPYVSTVMLDAVMEEPK